MEQLRKVAADRWRKERGRRREKEEKLFWMHFRGFWFHERPERIWPLPFEVGRTCVDYPPVVSPRSAERHGCNLISDDVPGPQVLLL